jgi:hypothetical protein
VYYHGSAPLGPNSLGSTPLALATHELNSEVTLLLLSLPLPLPPDRFETELGALLLNKPRALRLPGLRAPLTTTRLPVAAWIPARVLLLFTLLFTLLLC